MVLYLQKWKRRKEMVDLIPMLYGIPIEGIERDIKDGKYILKSRGNINSNIKAQTVIVYGNVVGNIKADQVVIINGNATGNINAETVTKLESKEKKTCKSCKYYSAPSIFYCEERKSMFANNKKICGKYQKKENPTKQVSSPHLPLKKVRY